MAPMKRTTRASPATTTTTTKPVTNAQLKALIDQGVANALAARNADRSMNGDDSHNSGTGVRRQSPLARECTYPDFMKCKPLYFKGTEGVVELTQWFKRMETVFRISNCTVENQINFATFTLLGSALTWWNSHVRTVGHDVAYTITWKNLKNKMTDKYCPRGEIKKLEVEMWNLKVKGADVVGYNQRFQVLALMYARMFPEESDKIKKYVGGLSDMIHGSVMASKPNTMQDAIEFTTELMDKKISTLDERVAIAYAAGSGERKEYGVTLPLCNKFKFHHNGQCTVKCTNCKRVGYLTRDCRSHAATNNQRNLTCYECGNQGNYRSDCLELKNQNHGNQAGGKENVVTNALSKKERIEPLRVRALVVTIGLDLPKQILNAQTEAQKPKNLKHRDVRVVRFAKRGKINPRYVGPFKVLEKVGSVAYKLELPQELNRVHNTFCVSNLKKCYADEPLAVPFDELHIDDKLHFVEEPVEIMD
ncbi:reverse transcriptase domain-containing protein [Tanacetum coccineum]